MGSSSGLSAVERTTCETEVSIRARKDAMQNTAVGFQPSSAGVAEGGLATCKTAVSHDKPPGVQPSPADSGNAEIAHGKGDGKGDGIGKTRDLQPGEDTAVLERSRARAWRTGRGGIFVHEPRDGGIDISG